MKTASIRLLKALWQQARSKVLSTEPNESVAFLTAAHYETTDKIVFLGDTVVAPHKSDYLKQGPYHLSVSPLYVNRVINVAEAQKNSVILVHSHPFDTEKPTYSPSDNYGEALTSETISKCLKGNPPVGSLLFGRSFASARAWSGISKETFSSSISVLAQNRFSLFDGHTRKNDHHLEPLVERQVRVLGYSVQNLLQSMEIGIVGLGGTGSAVAEQLVRMGIKHLTLVDNDRFEQSNWSRLYGSTWQDRSRNRYKVDLVSSHLAKLNPGLKIKKVKKSIMTKVALTDLASCDVVFSCLDQHAPRAVLNELSYQCFIPLIDIGVGMTKGVEGGLTGAARATIVGPELPCLLCQEIVRPEVITAEHLSPSTYNARRAEGYVSDVGHAAPSIVSFTTLAASFGIILFLELISSGKPTNYSTLLFDLASKETLKLKSSIKTDCVCHRRMGKGFAIPFSVAD